MKRGRKLLEKGKELLRHGDWERASEVFREALETLEGTELGKKGNRVLAEVLRNRAHAEARMAQIHQAERDLERSIKIASSIKDAKGLAEAYHRLGYVRLLEGEGKEAMKNFDKALRKAEGVDDPELLGRISIDIGNAHFHNYEFGKAKEEYTKAISLLEPTDDRNELARAYNNLGEAYKETGDLEESIEHLRLCMDMATSIGDLAMKGFAALNVAECFTRIGETRIAKEYLETALKVLKKTNDRIGLVHAWKVIGLTHRAEKEYDQAVEALTKCLRMARKLDRPILEGEVLRQLAEVHMAKGDPDTAKDLLKSSIEIFERMGRARDVEESKGLLESI